MPTRRLDDLHAEHSPEAIRRRLEATRKHSVLRDFIYGAIDGAVTTFAVVCGVQGAGLETRIIVILGVANLLADGFSMAVSNFLGTRAEGQQWQRFRREEEEHIAHVPDGEREEIRQIFARKGFAGADLERAVEIITSDVEGWIDTMLKEELGLSGKPPAPGRAATATFVAFLVVGAIPLLSFLIGLVSPDAIGHPFAWSIALTGLAFFLVGAVKGPLVGQRWLISGAETFAAGAVAAGLAYGVGAILKGL